ncbi:helix-turn-helix domain-containing protein [Paenibacillus arenilitoris]|uniref:Helix-turn-helix domain-containing protein n=1 Tax=Paenibacillus arenilitoris TaxID=2772299 RepID=A0A927CKH9_9BACL|nr:helix-turn-helix domain-containing protein [Paenibacillus arenilitoris]MBD2867861.1 helix-turn-helix domain-containing protein [Paenibacillus arenilitoris]
MYNVLIVDDEELAIRGITHGIDWSDLPIAGMFAAYDAEEAKELFADNRIDILLSDIDMPNENGIELLRWVNENSPETVTLFLTGHADFKFAQQAVQLDCFDYLLKPIDHAQLKGCIEGAIEKVKEQRQQSEIRSAYQTYYEQWNKQRPVLVERFWQDVFHYRISALANRLEPAMATYGIPLKADSGIRIVLISIEQWREEWSARDEEIMTYGVKNAAEELVLHGSDGHVVQDGSGILYIVFYDAGAETDAAVAERCAHFIGQCGRLLHCRLSCYIGLPVSVQQARENTLRLLELEKSNISGIGTVILEREYTKKAFDGAPLHFHFSDWALLLELGKRRELSHRIDDCFDRMQEHSADYAFMASFYFGFMNMVFQWLHKRSVQPTDVFPNGEWEEGGQALKSIPRLRAWTHQLCALTSEYARQGGKEASHVIEKVRRHIEEHLHEEFSREQAAEAVYLNPAYLSRLFRRETGRSLTDYLVEVRIAKAKSELESTNIRISDIAVSVGYSNFSHFSKLFKKETGLTPQEYRKKTQQT